MAWPAIAAGASMLMGGLGSALGSKGGGTEKTVSTPMNKMTKKAAGDIWSATQMMKPYWNLNPNEQNYYNQVLPGLAQQYQAANQQGLGNLQSMLGWGSQQFQPEELQNMVGYRGQGPQSSYAGEEYDQAVNSLNAMADPQRYLTNLQAERQYGSPTGGLGTSGRAGQLSEETRMMLEMELNKNLANQYNTMANAQQQSTATGQSNYQQLMNQIAGLQDASKKTEIQTRMNLPQQITNLMQQSEQIGGMYGMGDREQLNRIKDIIGLYNPLMGLQSESATTSTNTEKPPWYASMLGGMGGGLGGLVGGGGK